MSYTKDALTILKETSRTFYIPISKLPDTIKEAVASAYLCLRAIDEIEDHPGLPNDVKALLLRRLSFKLQQYKDDSTIQDLTPNWDQYESQVLEVSKRIGEWVLYCPAIVRGRVVDATAAMSDRMACWAEINWRIKDEKDLDAYTFSVAGAVGLLLSDMWDWWEGAKTDRNLAIGFGRGLQSVNILRNHDEDKGRSVEFYPDGWTDDQMFAFAERNLEMGKQYLKSLQKGGAAYLFCSIPLNLACATLSVMKRGKEKLSRQEVLKICEDAEGEIKSRCVQQRKIPLPEEKQVQQNNISQIISFKPCRINQLF